MAKNDEFCRPSINTMGLGLVFVEEADLQASDASSSSSTMQKVFSPEVAKRMFPLSNSVTGGSDLLSSFLQTNSPERRSWAERVLKKCSGITESTHFPGHQEEEKPHPTPPTIMTSS